MPSRATLVVFLVVNYGGLLVGYRWGIARAVGLLQQSRAPAAGTIRMPAYLPKLILLSMVFTIAGSAFRLYVMRGGLSAAFETLLNPGAAYREAQILAQLDRDGSIVRHCGVIVGFSDHGTLFQALNGFCVFFARNGLLAATQQGVSCDVLRRRGVRHPFHARDRRTEWRRAAALRFSPGGDLPRLCPREAPHFRAIRSRAAAGAHRVRVRRGRS